MIIFDPASKMVFSFNGKSHNASVIDPKTKAVTATIALGGKPEFGVADGKGQVFVNLEDKNSFATIDTTQMKVIATKPIQGCEEPTGLAMDTETRRLFIGCEKKLVVADADSGKVMHVFPAGEGIDGVAFNAAKKTAFASAGEGKITIIHEKSAGQFELLDTVATAKGARTLAFDPESQNIYLVTAKFGPPPPAKAGEKVRPSILPDTFVVMVMGF